MWTPVESVEVMTYDATTKLTLGSTKFTVPLVSATAVNVNTSDLIVALHSSREITQIDRDQKINKMVISDGNVLRI